MSELTTIEQEERDSTDEPRVGHYAWAKGEKVALCGQAIEGIPATGDCVVCARCAELRLLWEQF